MESRVVVLALIFTIIAACSKHELERQSFTQASLVQENEGQPSAFFSDWETVPSWTTQKGNNATIFSYIRQFPGLDKSIFADGVVLVFARNLWLDDPSLKREDREADKPLMMPFYFLPYFEKPDYTEQWTFNNEADKVTVSLVVKGTNSEASMPRKKIQLRYVVLPREVLRQKNQTVQTVRKLSYEQLIKTFSFPN